MAFNIYCSSLQIYDCTLSNVRYNYVFISLFNFITVALTEALLQLLPVSQLGCTDSELFMKL